MVLIPRRRITPTEGIQNYLAPTPLGTANVARPGGALPPQMSGENIDETPLVPAEGNKVSDLEYKSETRASRDLKYTEPDIPYTGSVNSQIWHSRHGGAYIEVSGKKGTPEFINIVHTSGTRITLDPNGSIIIKSFGDTHNVTKGNMYETTTGEKVQVNSGGYTIHVKNGTVDIRSEGNLNISSGADMSISAAGKLTMNIGDAIDIAGARVAMLARVDTMDLVSNSKTRITALSEMSIRSESSLKVLSNSEIAIKAASSITSQADGAYNIRSADATNIQAGAAINLKAGGNINADGSNVFLNSGRAGNAPNANEAEPAVKAGVGSELPKSVFSENAVSSSPSGSSIRGEGFESGSEFGVGPQ